MSLHCFYQIQDFGGGKMQKFLTFLLHILMRTELKTVNNLLPSLLILTLIRYKHVLQFCMLVEGGKNKMFSLFNTTFISICYRYTRSYVRFLEKRKKEEMCMNGLFCGTRRIKSPHFLPKIDDNKNISQKHKGRPRLKSCEL